ncbi:radical SAM protein [Chloroflexota bacterium]
MTPGYLSLFQTGDLERRVKSLWERLHDCDICPRACRVNRSENERGYCHSGLLPIVSSYCAHRGEEPVLSGSWGSGTIFFGNCNLRCVYCQNYQISQDCEANRRHQVSISELAADMLYLQDSLRCHNINLVTPSHFVPQILAAVLEAVKGGLNLPLVYNTSSYDSVRTLRELDGIVDIYLADLRYGSDEAAKRYSDAPDYVTHARAAIREMFRQVGHLVTDEKGVARRGLIIRHLILPSRLAGGEESLTWLAEEISPQVTISIMSQYYPAHRAYRFPELSRRITVAEYLEVIRLTDRLGLENGWQQGISAAENYLPDFRKEKPFV